MPDQMPLGLVAADLGDLCVSFLNLILAKRIAACGNGLKYSGRRFRFANGDQFDLGRIAFRAFGGECYSPTDLSEIFRDIGRHSYILAKSLAEYSGAGCTDDIRKNTGGRYVRTGSGPLND